MSLLAARATGRMSAGRKTFAPMKYSLRSLMIVVTLACIVLGSISSRVEYLRRWAVYHERRREEIHHERRLKQEEGIPGHGDMDAFPAWYHLMMAQRFRAAMQYPWTTVYDDLSVKEVREYLESPNSSAPSPNQPKQ